GMSGEEWRAGEPPQDRLRLPGREPADFGRAGARREGRIERVDIEAEIDRAVADNGADLLGDRGRSLLMYLLRRDDGDALGERPMVHGASERRANADLHHLPRLHQAFLDGVIEDRAMRLCLPEIIRPGVDMRVEVNERDRSIPFGERT